MSTMINVLEHNSLEMLEIFMPAIQLQADSLET